MVSDPGAAVAQWRVLDLVPRTWSGEVKKTLDAVGIESRFDEEDHSVRVPVEVRVTEDVETAWLWMERLLEIYEEARAAARHEGLEIKPYKPAERHILLAAGVEVIEEGHPPGSEGMFAEMLHRFVWRQGLPNANHRSTLAWIMEQMDRLGISVVSPDEAVRIGEEFAKESKKMITEKEWQSDLEPYRAKHRRLAEQAIAELLST